MTITITLSLMGCGEDSIFSSIGDGNGGNLSKSSKKVFTIEYVNLYGVGYSQKCTLLEGDRIGNDSTFNGGFTSALEYARNLREMEWYDNEDLIGEKISPDFVPTSDLKLYGKVIGLNLFEDEDFIYNEINNGTEYEISDLKHKDFHSNGEKNEFPQNIEIPSEVNGKKVTSLGMYSFSHSAFEGKELMIPKNISKIHPLAFTDYGLPKVIISEENEHFSIESDYNAPFSLYNKDKTKLIAVITHWGWENYSIAESVTTIEQ